MWNQGFINYHSHLTGFNAQKTLKNYVQKSSRVLEVNPKELHLEIIF